MGDRNAVTFYGRLLREGKAANDPEKNIMGTGSPFGSADAQNSFLEGMLEGLGSSPLPTSGGSDVSSSLLSSLLSNGSGSSNGMGLLGELLNPTTQSNGKFRGRKKKKRIDSLAKSVLTNVMKRMEDKDTQKTICSYLQSTNTHQIISYATMAGIPMKQESAERLVGIANSITPKGIRRSIRTIKRVLKVGKTVRKVLKVIDKYKTVLVLVMLFYWIKNAITQPFPVDNKRRARRLVANAAVGAVTE